MEYTSEISALLNLIDDPDEEIFGAVSDRIVRYGKSIIPALENLWEHTTDEEVQDRIELLIHRLHFTDLKEDFKQWSLAGHHDLLVGALLAAKFQYPDLATASVLIEIEKLRRNIWLELNNYLTPLEQVRIITGILYGYFGLKGTEVAYEEVNEFLIHKTLETKRGNAVSNAVLYLILCQLLDTGVKAIAVPRQTVLAFFKTGYTPEGESSLPNKIEFYIDPISGQVFTHNDIKNYFKRISLQPVAAHFKPQTNKQVIQTLINEMAKCFDADKQGYKIDELKQLSDLLD